MVRNLGDEYLEYMQKAKDLTGNLVNIQLRRKLYVRTFKVVKRLNIKKARTDEKKERNIPELPK